MMLNSFQMRFLFFFFFCSVFAPAFLFAQTATVSFTGMAVTPPGTAARTIHVTISKQTGMAQALTKLNFDGYLVTARALDGQAFTVPAVALWQGAEDNGLQPVMPLVANIAAAQKHAKSKTQVAATVAGEGLYIFSTVVGANIIKANPATMAGKVLRITPVVGAHELQKYIDSLTKTDPDPIATFSSAYLDATVVLSGLAVQRVFLSTAGGPNNVSFDVVVH
jgi:hypothetical protein